MPARPWNSIARSSPITDRAFALKACSGRALAGEKKYTDSEPLLLEGYQGIVGRKDRITVPDRYHLELAKRWVVQLYQAWGKPEKAAEWKKK